MAWCSKNHRNNKSMWCFCFERFCFHKFSWKLLTFNQREQSQFQLEMNVYCISWLRQIFEFDCCSCPSNISFKFINWWAPVSKNEKLFKNGKYLTISLDLVRFSPCIMCMQYRGGVQYRAEHPSRYSWYPPMCIMISPTVLNIPHGTQDNPHEKWKAF